MRVGLPGMGTGLDHPRSDGDGVTPRAAQINCGKRTVVVARFPGDSGSEVTKSREVPIRGRGLRHTGARGWAVAAVMAHSPANGHPGGVVRVRVEEYEKLMGSMLEEAERRIAEADEARDRAVAEAESLRSALEASERRQTSSARKFETWRAALVDAAADELAVETRRWRAVVAEKDAAIGALMTNTRRVGAGAATGAGTTAGANGREPNEQNTVPPRSPRRGGVSSGNNRSVRSVGVRPASRDAEEEEEEEARAVASLATTPSRARAGTHKRDRSMSAAPVAESPAALGDAARKAEASAKMRAATIRGETLERSGAVRTEGGGSGAGGSSTSTTSERKDERTETSFGFWPFW